MNCPEYNLKNNIHGISDVLSHSGSDFAAYSLDIRSRGAFPAISNQSNDSSMETVNSFHTICIHDVTAFSQQIQTLSSYSNYTNGNNRFTGTCYDVHY